MNTRQSIPLPLLLLGLVACGQSTPVITAASSPLEAHAGGALHLQVDSLPDGATVTWSGPPRVQALAEGSSPKKSALPQPGEEPAAYWLDNPAHYGAAELAGVLFVLDQGTKPNPMLSVTATIENGGTTEQATAEIPLTAPLSGDAARGAPTFAANCARCHGAQGQGGDNYPALNNNPGLPAAEWPAPLFANATRGDIDDMGVSLRVDMPTWLVLPSANGKLLTDQDFADVFAWLKTQNEKPVAP